MKGNKREGSEDGECRESIMWVEREPRRAGVNVPNKVDHLVSAADVFLLT